MSLFKKLSQINKDIEILEEYGDLKSANILHKKFIREAQRRGTNPPIYPESSQNDSPGPRNILEPQDQSNVRSYSALLNEIFMNYDSFDFIDRLYKEYQDNYKLYPPEEQAYLYKGMQRALKQRAKENLPNPPGSLAVAPSAPNGAANGPLKYIAKGSGVEVTRTPQTAPGATPGATPVGQPGAISQTTVEGTPQTSFSYPNTGDAFNPPDYRGPSTEFKYEDTSKSYNPEGYLVRNSTDDPTSTPTPKPTPTPAPTPTPETSETPLTQEELRKQYYINSKLESTKQENKAVALRMKPQIISEMKNGKIQKAQDILTDYKSVFSQNFIDAIQKVINRMNPKTYGIELNDQNNIRLTNHLYALMRNRSKNSFNGIESKFDSYGIKSDDKTKFIYFKNNLADIVDELFDRLYLTHLPE